MFNLKYKELLGVNYFFNFKLNKIPKIIITDSIIYILMNDNEFNKELFKNIEKFFSIENNVPCNLKLITNCSYINDSNQFIKFLEKYITIKDKFLNFISREKINNDIEYNMVFFKKVFLNRLSSYKELYIDKKSYFININGFDCKQMPRLVGQQRRFNKFILKKLGFDYNASLIYNLGEVENLFNLNINEFQEVFPLDIPYPCIKFIYFILQESDMREITYHQYTILDLKQDLFNIGIDSEFINDEIGI